MTVDVISKLAIKNGADSPIIDASSAKKGFAVVADNTERDAILASVKLGGYIVFNATSGNLERWNGSTWVTIVLGGGGGSGFRFTYSTTTTDADPGAGTFRADNATLSSATTLYVDLAEYGGTDITAWLDSIDDYVGAVKGIIRIQSLSDSTKWIEYTVTSWATATGYRKLTVAYKNGPGGISTSAGDSFVSFDAIGISQDLNNQALTNANSISFHTVSNGSLGATPTINFTTGSLQTGTLTANCSPTITPPSVANTAIRLQLTQDGTGNRTFTQPGSVTIIGNDPYISPTASTISYLDYWWNGTTLYLIGDISSQLKPRGSENVAIDLYPSTQSQGTIASGTPITFDVAIAVGKRYKIYADAWIDDGASGAVLYTKSLMINAHQTGSAAVKVTDNTIDDNFGSNYSFLASVSTTNIRFTLSNTSGSTRSYNIVIGYTVMDKP